MENDFLKNFIFQISKQQEQKDAEEKRKKHFQTIGRKGGLKKKTSGQFSKVVSVRLTEKEFEEIEKQASKYNLKISKYLRLILTEKELKINEFKTDEVLLQYGNHFIRIKNLLRHHEFSEFENKKQILHEIEIVTNLIYQYLYEKQNKQKPT
ncbi:plasmid mobilization protein [Elizabethkingia miricola]|uniref:plasmid mobilization protein n=1 Tax=Elizabethkingia miricola TaxID=172045 RepID=UPI002ACE003F|nr:special sigma factor [Elizabethkingia miricola]WQM40486.1 special sigma factor [Elizabethkingia miricola]